MKRKKKIMITEKRGYSGVPIPVSRTVNLFFSNEAYDTPLIDYGVETCCTSGQL